MNYQIIGINNEERYSIPKEEYINLMDCRLKYSKLLKIEEMYHNLIKNYRDLEIASFKISIDSILYRDYSWNTFKDRIHETDRLLINLLTHTRLFLDKSDQIIKSVYGKESKEHEYFKSLKSTKYDSNFSYRLMEALRNYVLHGDLPIGRLKIDNRVVEMNGEKKKVFDCSPKLNIEQIRSDRNIKPSVLKEIESYSEIEMRYHTRSFVSDLSGIHKMFNDYQMDSLNIILSKLEAMKNYFSNPQNVNGVIFIDNEKSENSSFTFEMLYRMKELIELNSTYHQIHELLIML
jgi:hypothetical protein